MKFNPKLYGFRELTLEQLLAEFPNQTEALLYLPDHLHPGKIDRVYALNVHLQGFNTVVLEFVWDKIKLALKQRRLHAGDEKRAIEKWRYF